MTENWRPDLSNQAVLLGLPPRTAPYFQILQYCRHIGLHVRKDSKAYWVARIRRKDGAYSQSRLALAYEAGVMKRDFDEAKVLAERWFSSPSVASIAAEPYQLGSKREISICPIGPDHTVGHALSDYLNWKILAATRSHFEALVSLINYHLVPRISHVLLHQFDGRVFQDLAVEVMETPPKHGNQIPTTRNDLRSMSDEELRKRKKTFNALVSILRGAFELAWERGHIESDRPIRCLRRLPNVDRPRIAFLDRQECHSLLEACHPDLQVLVLAALYTGCRANELTAMHVKDFSPTSKSVFVASPKGRRTRHVLLPSEGVEFFRKTANGRPGNERLIVKANGRIWGSEYKTYFLRARSEAGLPKAVTFHGLRHTYASQLLQNGASLITVADQLGHANTQTVSATYGHLSCQSRAKDIEHCFEPLQTRATEKPALVEPIISNDAYDDLPVFYHRTASSWPRANHSKYSGPLLAHLSPNRWSFGDST